MTWTIRALPFRVSVARTFETCSATRSSSDFLRDRRSDDVACREYGRHIAAKQIEQHALALVPGHPVIEAVSSFERPAQNLDTLATLESVQRLLRQTHESVGSFASSD